MASMGERIGRAWGTIRDRLSFLRYALWAAGLAALVGWVLFLDYTLPSSRLIHVTGTEVVRMDSGESATGQPITRDVRLIEAVALDNEPLVFRNEDTGWGWPPYFKFDSGTLGSQAQGIAQREGDSITEITYYGWRIEMLSMYPNAISLEPATAETSLFPWGKIIFLAILHGALIFGGYAVWRLFRRLRGKAEEG